MLDTTTWVVHFGGFKNIKIESRKCTRKLEDFIKYCRTSAGNCSLYDIGEWGKKTEIYNRFIEPLKKRGGLFVCIDFGKFISRQEVSRCDVPINISKILVNYLTA